MLTFRPKVSAILNITPDHLDRHKTMENYGNIKKSIAKNQTKDDFCVLNFDDAVLREFGKECKAKVVFFSSKERLCDGIYYENKNIYTAEGGVSELFLSTDEVKLVGVHNYENIMAAIAITRSFGVPDSIIKETVKNFVAVEHRIEYVETVNGVKYYNDSKGTNTDAAIKAIDAMPSKTVLIAGGYDKNSEYYNEDGACYSTARKEVDYGGEKCTLICVTIKGTSSDEEWYGNLSLQGLQ